MCALTIDDGRRVFKTEDGVQVFDEFGTEIAPSVLDFELIDASKPTWKNFLKMYLQKLDYKLKEKN